MSYIYYLKELHAGDMVRWNKNIRNNWRKFNHSGWRGEPLDCVLTVDRLINSSNSSTWLVEFSCSMGCGCHEVLSIAHNEYTAWSTALGEPLLLWAGMCDLIVNPGEEIEQEEYSFETDRQYIIELIKQGTLDGE